MFKLFYKYNIYERKDLGYNYQGRKPMFLWDEKPCDLLAQYSAFIISFREVYPCVKSASRSKDTLSEYLRTAVRESMFRELVRWATQTTIAMLATVRITALETLVEPE